MTEADLDKATPWQPKGLEAHFATYGKALLTVAMHQMAHRAQLTGCIPGGWPRHAGSAKAGAA